MSANVKPRQGAEPSMPCMLVGLLVAPLAWIAQMLIAETLAAQSCYPTVQPLSAPVFPWMRSALIVISALCFAAGAFGALTAWRNLRRLRAAKESALSGLGQSRPGLDAFLIHVAAMCSALFLFALIATDIALALVSPCKWW